MEGRKGATGTHGKWILHRPCKRAGRKAGRGDISCRDRAQVTQSTLSSADMVFYCNKGLL